MEVNSNIPPVQNTQAGGKPVHAQPAGMEQPEKAFATDKAELKTLPKGNASVAPIFPKQDADLPPIEVVKDGRFTYMRNAFGLQITAVDFPDGKYYNILSDQGMSIILRQHNDKRDTLDFSDMNHNIPSNSRIPNVYFHVKGEGESQLFFNKQHHVVIQLANGETAVLDRQDGQTLLNGPFKIKFNPEETGQNFDIIYTGPNHLPRYKSHGDHIDW